MLLFIGLKDAQTMTVKAILPRLKSAMTKRREMEDESTI